MPDILGNIADIGDLNVVFIDDEPDLLKVGRSLLEKNGGFHVATFESASEAMQHLRANRADAIVCDYIMPDMNGLEFLTLARKEFGDIPFILFTGRGQEETVIQAMERAVDFYVRKDKDAKRQFEELREKIIKAVREHRERAAQKESASILSETQKALNAASFSVSMVDDHVRFSAPLQEWLGESAETKEQALSIMERRVYLADQDRLKEALRSVMSQQVEKMELEVRVLPQTGEMRTLSMRLKTNKEGNGRPISVLGILQDVTEEKKQEERIRVTLTKVTEGIIIVDREGVVRFLNQRAVDLFILDEDVSRGRKLKELIPGIWAEAQRHLQDGGRYELFDVIIEDEEDIELRIAVEPIRQGQLWIARDVSREKRQERILEESEEQYSRIMKNVHEGICCINNDGTITYCNESFMKMLNLGEEDVVGHSIVAFLTEGTRLMKLMSSEEEPVQAAFRSPNGKSFRAQVRSLTITDEEENPTGAILFII
jgi:PAS domain S-box-containing protein